MDLTLVLTEVFQLDQALDPTRRATGPRKTFGQRLRVEQSTQAFQGPRF